MIERIIPSSGGKLPVIGLGTWQTFDVHDSSTYPVLETVLSKLHSAGGKFIDSSPMYGMSEKAIGDISSQMETADDFFYATKVWTTGLEQGIEQMEDSMRKMKRKTMDLIQIHNLVDWKTHLPQLRRWKESGKIRYIGITHYTDSSHEDLMKVMKAEKPDFVQFNFSILARNAETKLLPLASELGIATIINRPFGEGNLFKLVKGKSLPPWAADLRIDNWASYFLKYIISNRAVTCVIPATGNPAHADDIMKAGSGNLPTENDKKKMQDYLNVI